MSRIWFALLCGLLLIVAVPGWAVDRYADHTIGTGSCSNYNPATRTCSGGSAQAYNTVKACADQTFAGDRCLVRSGLYTEGVWLINSGTSSTQRVVIGGYESEVAEIRPNSGDPINPIYIESADYITVEKLIIDGRNVPHMTVQIGNFNQDAHHIIIQDGKIRNGGKGILTVAGPSSGLSCCSEFRRNVIHSNGGDDPDGFNQGMYIQGQNNIIEDNIVFGNTGAGIAVTNDHGRFAHNNIVSRNR